MKKKHKYALTLLEMLVSILILSVIAAAIFHTFNHTVQYYNKSSDKTKCLQQAHLALSWLDHDISCADCVYEVGSDFLSLRHPQQGPIKYYLPNATTLVRQQAGSPANLLSSLIENFTLTSYNENNQPSSSIKQVEINIQTALDDQKFNLYSVSSPPPPKLCLWAKTFDAGGSEEIGSLEKINEGNYILAGNTNALGTYADFFLTKVDAAGNIIWFKIHDFEVFTSCTNTAMQQTDDGGYILGGVFSDGTTGADPLLVKTDSDGNIGSSGTWTKYYEATSNDQADGLTKLLQASDSGYILGGSSYSWGPGGHDWYVIKIDSAGDIQWAKAYGGTETDSLAVLIETSGGYILGGMTEPVWTSGSPNEFLVMKTDYNGDVGAGFPGTWATAYGRGDNIVGFSALLETEDGYILGGKGNFPNGFSGPGYHDALLMKIDGAGNLVWAKLYGGQYNDTIQRIKLTANGYVMAGTTRSFDGYRFFLMETDAQGNLLWFRTYGSQVEQLNDLKDTEDGGYLLGGFTTPSWSDPYNLFAVKTDNTGNVDNCSICIQRTFTPIDVTADITVITYPTADSDFTYVDFLSNVSAIDKSITVVDYESNVADTYMCPE